MRHQSGGRKTNTNAMKIAGTQERLRDLERKPERVQRHKTGLEVAIAQRMDEVHRLAQHGEKGRKTRLAVIEYRMRLLTTVGAPERRSTSSRFFSVQLSVWH